ncbi:MAG TPA: MFS transporter [Thermoanaerobaculia bacterium]|nr:MFS transporter [Thermoanaerobaculia bacterium]
MSTSIETGSRTAGARPEVLPPFIPRERRFAVFAGLMLVLFLAALDSAIVATALPTIVGELGGLAHLSWVVTAYLVGQTVVTPLYGKLGDLYGRKRVLQVAAIIFLAGSALCGFARTLTQLIFFRFLQGLGGGGIIVSTQASLGDIVPPRERGRYQGIFGAVFGVSSILGPLLGGFFTTHLSWRWIFYVNLPLGVIALAVLAVTLPTTAERLRRQIDYAGAALLAGALTAIVLLADLGGSAAPWGSPLVIGLTVAALLLLVAFVRVERQSSEPLVPLHLFRNPVFNVTSAIGFIVGFALFGAVTYLPLFLQLVKGSNPTVSGLELVPMMAGMLSMSILAGNVVSHVGRYRLFPIVGTAVLTVGLYLLSRMDMTTSRFTSSLDMLIVGMGLGMVMQVLVLAVQNAVDYEDLGVATSGATLFRLIGGSFGVAVLGAIFASRLETALSRAVPPRTFDVAHIAPATLLRLPPATRNAYVAAFSGSLRTVFLVAAVVALVSFLISWFLEDRPLRETVAASGAGLGEGFAMPSSSDSLTQISHGLFLLMHRDARHRILEQITARAGVDLDPEASWLLSEIERCPDVEIERLAREFGVDPERLGPAWRELEDRGLIVAGREPCAALTPAGRDVSEKLSKARRERLGELLADWAPEQHRQVAEILRTYAEDVEGEEMSGRPGGKSRSPV